MELTANQLETARFIWISTKRNGFPPTLREIAEEFGISCHSAFIRLSGMRKKGILEDCTYKARALRFTEEFRKSEIYKMFKAMG